MQLGIDGLYQASVAILKLPSALSKQLDPVFDFGLLELAHEQWQLTTNEAVSLNNSMHQLAVITFGAPVGISTQTIGTFFNGNLGSGRGHMRHWDILI